MPDPSIGHDIASNLKQIRGKTCAVLGAGGFLGRRLATALASFGATVHAFGRNLKVLPTDPNITLFPGDFLDDVALSQALKSADIVFHLISATTPASAEMDRALDIRTNLIGSLNLIDLCCSLDVPRIVFASSGGTIYGSNRGRASKEADLPRPLCQYAITKLAIEHAIGAANFTRGMSNISLRLANPFGPGQAAEKQQGFIGAVCRAAITGSPLRIWGDGTAVRDYVYTDDVIDAFALACLYHGPFDALNIGTATGRSLNTVIEDVEQLCGQKLERSYSKGRSFDVAVNILDNTLAFQELGWAPRSDWHDALRNTLSWAEQHWMTGS